MPTAENAIDIATNHFIPMRDGMRLAATLYRPARGTRWPCLVNYIPYHKDGRGGLWYDTIHRHFAERGYATLVIDFRGLGCSEGINNIPFDAQEGRDGHDAVEWAAAQPWCDGNVGMWGTSYGGITSLKTASERPPHLKAIVPIHATYDNYLDFLLLGGCRNGFWPNGDWGPRMIAYNLTPPLRPDPDGRLAKVWAERLERSQPWCLEWYNSNEEAARWAGRAIPIENIAAATLAVCGWKDFYVQGTLDYFQRLTCVKKLLMGPWKHVFPNLSLVEPVNLLEMMVRWFDRWLRGDNNAADSGPPITLFVQGSGVWRNEESWPPRRNEAHELYLSPGRLQNIPPPNNVQQEQQYEYDPTAGLDSIGFDPWTSAVIDPGDHNADDARSLCFTSEPLADDWELTGQSHVKLTSRASVPGLNYVAKLCDVQADGRSRLVTMGWSPDGGAPTNAIRNVEIPLRASSYNFAAGHRIRLVIALADFPRLWPTPVLAEIRLLFSAKNPTRLLLPRTPPQQPSLPHPVFPPAGPVLKSPFELESTQRWRVSRELVQQTASLESQSRSRYQLRDAGTITYDHEYAANVSAQDPAGTAIRIRSNVEVQQPGRTVEVKTESVFSPQTVTIHAEIEQDGKTIFCKDWQREMGE